MNYVAVTDRTVFGVFALYKKNWIVINPHFPDKVKELFDKFKIKYEEIDSSSTIIKNHEYKIIQNMEGYLHCMGNHSWDEEEYLDNIKGIGLKQFVDDDNFEYIECKLNDPNYEFYTVKDKFSKIKAYPQIKEIEYKDAPPDCARAVRSDSIMAIWRENLTSAFYEALKYGREEFEGIYYACCLDVIEEERREIVYGDYDESVFKKMEVFNV